MICSCLNSILQCSTGDNRAGNRLKAVKLTSGVAGNALKLTGA